MQVVLISPYSQIENTGLRLLSACLKQAGFPTRMIFLPDLDEMMVAADYGSRRVPPDALAQIVSLCADAGLVGVSVMTTNFYMAKQLTEAVKAAYTIPVIWGGVHPTVCPEECLEIADLVCIGEGERAIVALAETLAAGGDPGLVPNLAWRSPQGGIEKNGLAPLVTDLDDLPFPDYDFAEHYLQHDGVLLPCSAEMMDYYLTDLGSWASGPAYGVLTTRGCPYHCTYCVNDALVSIYPAWCQLRRRSPENVIAEIEAARAVLPAISAIVIRDDTFLANPDAYIARFSALYKERVGLPFRAYTTAQTAKKAKLAHLVEAGLRLAIMGIQTGSPRTQRLYKRSVSNDKILSAANLLHRFQAAVPRPMYDVITDNPYENEEDRYNTLRLVHQLPPPYRLSLFSLTFYPGTALHQQAVQDGIVAADDPEIYERNFQMVAHNFYNFALVCHSLNLPRFFLWVLTRRPVFQLFSRGWLDRLAGWGLGRLLALRLRANRRLYQARRARWLAENGAGDGA